MRIVASNPKPRKYRRYRLNVPVTPWTASQPQPNSAPQPEPTAPATFPVLPFVLICALDLAGQATILIAWRLDALAVYWATQAGLILINVMFVPDLLELMRAWSRN